MPTTVVNIRKANYDVYIGRGSIWGNPFKIGQDGTREEVIEKYRQWIQTQPQLLARIGELKGKVLGCFCKIYKENELLLPDEIVRTMTVDDFIEYMLDIGKYKVNIETQTVFGVDGQPLKPTVNKAGYLVLGFVHNRKIVKQVKLHRVIALVVYGKKAIFGKQVAHLDGNPLNNKPDNLQPMEAKEHIYYDETYKNLHGREPKTNWQPCVRCGDSDGIANGITPDRINGKKFGYDGQLCRTCYHTLDMKERRKRNACHGDILAELADKS